MYDTKLTGNSEAAGIAIFEAIEGDNIWFRTKLRSDWSDEPYTSLKNLLTIMQGLRCLATIKN